MEQKHNNGQIVGRASVLLGNNIELGTLVDKDTGEPIGIGMMELLDEIQKQFNFGTQVRIIFPNLMFVDQLRTALDNLETEMKKWARNALLNKDEKGNGSTDK